MSNINLNISFNPKVVIAVLAIIGIAAYAYKIPETKAQASSTLTGKYGCVDNPNSLPYVTAFTGRPETTYLNGLYIVDFDSRTSSGFTNTINNFNGSYNGSYPARGIETGTISFSVGATATPGMIQITNSSGLNKTFAIVNSGNTLLGIDTQIGTNGQPSNVVCQKV
jgi:hypothetical protein